MIFLGRVPRPAVRLRWSVALALACALAASLLAQAQLPVPPLAGHVTDQTGTLTQEQKASLELTLTAFEARKGSQLAVLLVATTAPEPIEQYAIRVAEQWKLGRKKVDDGVILVVAKDDRTVRMEVGYGLEGALPDITARRIIDESILPKFKVGDFYGGLAAGVDQTMRVIDGEPLPERSGAASDLTRNVRQLTPVLLIVALAVGGILRRAIGHIPGALVTGVVVAALAWLVIGTLMVALISGVAAMFFTLLGFGGFGPLLGGMGGGGGGGGGFRGGGGGFGGGGASGRW